jgi:peptidoglycan/LPS O-acetylase OafA/YrhL
MKHLEKMKTAITVLVALCLLCAVAAFFLPNTQGMVLSCLAIALATIVAVLCVAGMAMLMHQHNAAA